MTFRIGLVNVPLIFRKTTAFSAAFSRILPDWLSLWRAWGHMTHQLGLLLTPVVRKLCGSPLVLQRIHRYPMLCFLTMWLLHRRYFHLRALHFHLRSWKGRWQPQRFSKYLLFVPRDQIKSGYFRYWSSPFLCSRWQNHGMSSRHWDGLSRCYPKKCVYFMTEFVVIQWYMILGIQAKPVFEEQEVAFVSSQGIESHNTICLRNDEHVK